MAVHQRLGLPASARAAGTAIVAASVLVAALLAAPWSWSDLSHRGVQTVYPLMTLPLLAVMAGAGIAAACSRAAAVVVAPAATVAGLQVAGIAVVASRDWYSFAGSDYASWERATAGSLLSLMIALLAAATVAAGLLLSPLDGRDRAYAAPLFGAVVTVVAVPLLLTGVAGRAELTAVGQYALWWSVPWGVGLFAAATSRTFGARCVALLSVVFSVAVAIACAQLPVVAGFGLRLPG